MQYDPYYQGFSMCPSDLLNRPIQNLHQGFVNGSISRQICWRLDTSYGPKKRYQSHVGG